MKSPPLQTLRAKPLVYKARFFVATREAVGGGGGGTQMSLKASTQKAGSAVFGIWARTVSKNKATCGFSV